MIAEQRDSVSLGADESYYGYVRLKYAPPGYHYRRRNGRAFLAKNPQRKGDR